MTTTAPGTVDGTQAQARRETLLAGLRRHPAALFQFDQRMADGWYSDRYFVRAAETLRHAGRDPVVTMQLFAKRHGVLAGVFEAIRMLQTQCAADVPDAASAVVIDTLVEGDVIAPWEPVMHITGPYRAFAHLETTYLGVLARRTLVASNVRRVQEAAKGKPVIYMGARHDDWRVQTPDGYAARVGGLDDVSSDAGGAWWGMRGVGTMPHAMIAAFGGDTVAATIAFTRYVLAREPAVRIVSLVDYDNDAVATSRAVARAMRQEFGEGRLWGVRIDTSEQLVDRSLQERAAAHRDERLNGVVPELVCAVRAGLDAEGATAVQIGVSGGFNPVKIARFERERVPVGFYGIGSSLLGHNSGEADGLVNSFDFTADIVRVDGRAESKVGREGRPNPRFVRVDATLLAEADERVVTAQGGKHST